MNEIINDAECGVIGGLLTFPEEASEAIDKLCWDDFSLEPYREIFKTPGKSQSRRSGHFNQA